MMPSSMGTKTIENLSQVF
jgi:hypothetical protein